jgi:hypothetical protein
MGAPQTTGATKAEKEMSEHAENLAKAATLFKEYLTSHESDIAYEINDFGMLKSTFERVIGRKPLKQGS